MLIKTIGLTVRSDIEPPRRRFLTECESVDKLMRYCRNLRVSSTSFVANNMVVTVFHFRAIEALHSIVALSILMYFYSTMAADLDGTTESQVEDGSARYLVYPTPGTFAPTKVQLIVGLGLPMEVDVSMIVGYVMKFNYVLPYNASYLTHPNVIRYDRSIDPRSILLRRAATNVEEEAEAQTDEEEKEIKEDAAEDRKVEGVPIASANAEEDEEGTMSRWEMYRDIVTTLDGFELSGKSCLLRTVCQLAEAPFDDSRVGLVAQLIHVLLTPSMTREKYLSNDDQEYLYAEAAGKEYPGNCEILFPECQHDLLEYFTETNENDESAGMINFSL